MAIEKGGGISLQRSTLTASNSSINNNTADYAGGGLYARTSCSIMLSQGTSANGNAAAIYGGGVFVVDSTLMVLNSSINSNAVGYDGGGTYAGSSSIMLGDSTSIVRNVAGGRGGGGGICLETSSSLTITSRTSICSNSAHRGRGGGILASTSTVQLGAGVLTFCSNTASSGGAFALTDASRLIDSGESRQATASQPATYLTVRNNTASTGDGGGLAISGDSTVGLSVTAVAISHNTAAHSGGGLVVNGSVQEEAESSDTESSDTTACSTDKVTFWQLDLVYNTAQTGDGGGLFSASNILLRQGGQTNATGNTAVRGGSVALSDAVLIVQSGHTFIAQHNVAEKDGGAIALFSGARLSLLEVKRCPSSCVSPSRSNQYCDSTCMSVECNWDGGDCVQWQMDTAGADALSPCNRADCSLFHQTNAGVHQCVSSCFTASCDWSRQQCVKPRDHVQACPLIDAAAFASIKTAQQYQAPVFLTGGNSQGGFGRCSSAWHQPATPPYASSLLGSGMVGSGALHLIPKENGTDPAGWVYVAINTHRVGDSSPAGVYCGIVDPGAQRM